MPLNFITNSTKCWEVRTSDASTIWLLLILQASDNLSLHIERYSQLIEAAFCNSESCIFHLAQITCRQQNTIKMYANDSAILPAMIESFKDQIIESTWQLQYLQYSQQSPEKCYISTSISYSSTSVLCSVSGQMEAATIYYNERVNI